MALERAGQLKKNSALKDLQSLGGSYHDSRDEVGEPSSLLGG